MKHPGSKVEFTDERNAELLAAFRDIMRQSAHINVHDIMRRVVRQPCSRFWVSEERATNVIYLMQRGDPLHPRTLPERRRMYEEINRRVTALRRERPGASLPALVAEVVNMPAPEFYLSPMSAATVYYRAGRRG